MTDEAQNVVLPDSVWDDYEYTSIHVAVLVADFLSKPAITNALSPSEYNEMINVYQRSMLEMIEELRSQGREIGEVYQTGGQLMICFYSKQEVEWNFQLDGPAALEGSLRKKLAAKCRRHKEELAYSALKSAIQIKNHWMIQEFNIKRMSSHKSPWELGIGLHSSRGYLGMRPDGQLRVEGDLHDQAKQISELSSHGIYSRIMLSNKTRDYISRMVVAKMQLRQRVFFHQHDFDKIGKSTCLPGDCLFELKFYHRIGIHVPQEAIEQYSSIYARNQANRWAYDQLVDYYGFVAHDWKKAFDLAKSTRQAHPRDEKVLLDLAWYYLKTGQLEESKKHAEEALAINPSFDLVHEQLAIIAHEMGDIEGQIRHMRESVFLSPNSPVNNFNLGLSLLDNCQPEEGYYYLQEALKLHPEFEKSQHFRETLANLKSEGKLPELLEYYLELQAEEEQKRLDEQPGEVNSTD